METPLHVGGGASCREGWVFAHLQSGKNKHFDAETLNLEELKIMGS